MNGSLILIQTPRQDNRPVFTRPPWRASGGSG